MTEGKPVTVATGESACMALVLAVAAAGLVVGVVEAGVDGVVQVEAFAVSGG